MSKEEWVRKQVELLLGMLSTLSEENDPDGQRASDIQQELSELRSWRQQDY